MSIQSKINEIKSSLPDNVRLVAVSKYHPAEMIQEAYDGGQRIFGESHVQEVLQKVKVLPEDIEWHFIGHLQTNKVKQLLPHVSMIHSVDSLRLIREIEKQAAKINKEVNILLQLHVAQEETKFGWTIDEADDMLSSNILAEFPHIHVAGIMCMASNVDDDVQIASEFETARNFFEHARKTYFKDSPEFKECSMGMSDDYPVAIEHGSTLIRVGSKIFGQRMY